MNLIVLKKFSVPLALVPEGVTTFPFEGVGTDFSGEKGNFFPDPISGKARVTAVDDDYLVELNLKSMGKFVCDRCGISYSRKVQGEIKTLFTTDPVKWEGKQDADTRQLDPYSQEIDFSQDVLDALVLAIPIKSLCHKDCRGLCPHCGINRNEESCSCSDDKTDPRWDALEKISF